MCRVWARTTGSRKPGHQSSHGPLRAAEVLGESHDEGPTSDVTIQHAGSTLHASPLPAHFP